MHTRVFTGSWETVAAGPLPWSRHLSVILPFPSESQPVLLRRHNTSPARRRRRARTCWPTISLTSHYVGISRKRQELLVTRDAWLSRTLNGEGLPSWDRHKNRLPFEFKGLKLVEGREERKKENATTLTTSFIRAFYGLRISRLLKKKWLKTGVITSSPLKNELFLTWNLWKRIWLFTLTSASLPKCSHSNNIFGPMFKFLLGFGFPFRIRKQIRKSLLRRQAWTPAGAGRPGSGAAGRCWPAGGPGLSRSQSPPCTVLGWPGRSAGAFLRSHSCHKRDPWCHSAFDSSSSVLFHTDVPF